jgi:hypothetical protein
MSGDAIRGALADVNFAFDADAADVVAYARLHLEALRNGHGEPANVCTRLRWHEGQPPPVPVQQLVEAEGLLRVDRDLFVSADRLCWFRVDDLRDLHLRFSWEGQRLSVQGDFYHRLGNSELTDWVRRVASRQRTRRLRQRRFTTLLYYLVYYPCWWWLEHVRGLHPIHAAGVATDAGVVLLAGASGVGKSTLAVALATLPEARLLSDSFVLHQGVHIHAVPEPVLLDSWSRTWLGARADLLRPLQWKYGLGRDGYTLAAEHLAAQGRAALLLFPRRGATSAVRSLPAEEARQRLSAADLIINDLRRYWAFAAVLEHMQPGGLVARRESELQRLTAAVPAYELTLTAETKAEAATAMVRDLLAAGSEGPPQRQP